MSDADETVTVQVYPGGYITQTETVVAVASASGRLLCIDESGVKRWRAWFGGMLPFAGDRVLVHTGTSREIGSSREVAESIAAERAK